MTEVGEGAEALNPCPPTGVLHPWGTGAAHSDTCGDQGIHVTVVWGRVRSLAEAGSSEQQVTPISARPPLREGERQSLQDTLVQVSSRHGTWEAQSRVARSDVFPIFLFPFAGLGNQTQGLMHSIAPAPDFSKEARKLDYCNA